MNQRENEKGREGGNGMSNKHNQQTILHSTEINLGVYVCVCWGNFIHPTKLIHLIVNHSQKTPNSVLHTHTHTNHTQAEQRLYLNIWSDCSGFLVYFNPSPFGSPCLLSNKPGCSNMSSPMFFPFLPLSYKHSITTTTKKCRRVM